MSLLRGQSTRVSRSVSVLALQLSTPMLMFRTIARFTDLDAVMKNVLPNHSNSSWSSTHPKRIGLGVHLSPQVRIIALSSSSGSKQTTSCRARMGLFLRERRVSTICLPSPLPLLYPVTAFRLLLSTPPFCIMLTPTPCFAFSSFYALLTCSPSIFWVFRLLMSPISAVDTASSHPTPFAQRLTSSLIVCCSPTLTILRRSK